MAPDDAVLDRAGEAVVTAVVEAQALALLTSGCDVVADATHLSPEHIAPWRAIAAEHGATVEVVDMGVGVEECIRRDTARREAGGRGVGALVIRRMAASGAPTYDQA